MVYAFVIKAVTQLQGCNAKGVFLFSCVSFFPLFVWSFLIRLFLILAFPTVATLSFPVCHYCYCVDENPSNTTTLVFKNYKTLAFIGSTFLKEIMKSKKLRGKLWSPIPECTGSRHLRRPTRNVTTRTPGCSSGGQSRARSRSLGLLIVY